MKRIVLGEFGGGGPERGVDPLARDLRDAGHEVVYTGPDESPARLAATAVQEDADLVGLWVAPGAGDSARLPTFFRELRAALDARDAADVAVFVAGAIEAAEAGEAEQAGADHGFPEPTPVAEITGWVEGRAERQG